MTDWNVPAALATPNERELRTLCRAIALSEGQFSLILLHCNDTRLHQPLMKQLRERCTVPIRELALPKSAQTLYTTICTELGNEKPRALVVSGLESLIDLDQVLLSANLVRDEFRKTFPFPLVLWVTDAVMRKLLRLAPDFESWATAPIQLVATPDQQTSRSYSCRHSG
jgi:hypothetical protein